ncbi:hypothetical protein ONS95_004190 [Cadophora gregata]|uniref:uncharacterized protein n=1 Tax=Cadophora gregata TaxID=51156 RepID=UPI0026DB6647|nr:uncharacterized protein ONS95_004190 [Cadophora gregata]KAK0105442.1 hypothetical protein ONS96_004829 [Cadophora gregata f. sp. sojae]KAK0105663.1 hypothetical protein ONS95_004190 [Cadophora gregata]
MPPEKATTRSSYWLERWGSCSWWSDPLFLTIPFPIRAITIEPKESRGYAMRARVCLIEKGQTHTPVEFEFSMWDGKLRFELKDLGQVNLKPGSFQRISLEFDFNGNSSKPRVALTGDKPISKTLASSRLLLNEDDPVQGLLGNDNELSVTVRESVVRFKGIEIPHSHFDLMRIIFAMGWEMGLKAGLETVR